MTRHGIVLGCAVVLAAMCGCGGAPDAGSGGATDTRPTGPTVGQVPTVSNVGTMQGSLGSVQSFGSGTVRVQGQGGATVQLDAVNTDARWWVMNRMTFTPALSDPSWAVGMNQTFSNGLTSASGQRIWAMGCSGPSMGDYTFDGEPTTVVVHIDPGSTPGSKLLSYAAYWGTQAVTGSFEYNSTP